MNIKRFNRGKSRTKILIYSSLGILFVIGSIVLYKTYAFYEEKKSFNVLKGRIPDFGYDIKMLSVVIDDKKSDAIPSRGMYKTNVHCTNGTFGEWDYNNWNLTLNNVSSESKCNLTFTSGLSEEEYNKYIEAGVSLHRNTYRGKDITEYYNDGSLYTRISNGTFEDIYTGDYIEANGVTWLIADLDNYLYSGSPALTQHHATIIPARPLINEKMNETDTTQGGYIGSKMATEILPELVSENGTIGKVFGSHILEYNTVLSNRISTTATNQTGNRLQGASDESGTYTRKADLMSEINIYGTNVWSSSGYDTGIDNRQYSLFQLKPELINTYGKKTFAYWLKNVTSSTGFARIFGSSEASYGWYASGTLGVRPRFLID